MNKEEVCQAVKQIVVQVAGIPLSELENDHLLRDELMLDSLKEMEIVARTEMHFGICLEEGDLLALRTLGEYCDLVARVLLVLR